MVLFRPTLPLIMTFWTNFPFFNWFRNSYLLIFRLCIPSETLYFVLVCGPLFRTFLFLIPLSTQLLFFQCFWSSFFFILLMANIISFSFSDCSYPFFYCKNTDELLSSQVTVGLILVSLSARSLRLLTSPETHFRLSWPTTRSDNGDKSGLNSSNTMIEGFTRTITVHGMRIVQSVRHVFVTFSCIIQNITLPLSSPKMIRFSSMSEPMRELVLRHFCVWFYYSDLRGVWEFTYVPTQRRFRRWVTPKEHVPYQT